MRGRIILAVAFCVVAATGARADDWCGYTTRAHAMIECGYSSASECASAIGKGAMCFVDPEYAVNVQRAKSATAPQTTAPAFASR
jgi:hypothetical protein